MVLHPTAFRICLTTREFIFIIKWIYALIKNLQIIVILFFTSFLFYLQVDFSIFILLFVKGFISSPIHFFGNKYSSPRQKSSFLPTYFLTSLQSGPLSEWTKKKPVQTYSIANHSAKQCKGFLEKQYKWKTIGYTWIA